jgi:hypothetical protein
MVMERINNQWVCLSCAVQVALDIHGRCSFCGSDAVDRLDRGASLSEQSCRSDRQEATFPVLAESGPRFAMKAFLRNRLG